MFRRIVLAAVIGFIGISAAVAEEFGVLISKVDGNKITFTKLKKGEKVGTATTLPATADLKVNKGRPNAETKKLEPGDPIAAGLKSEVFSKITDEGIRARIVTDAENKHITAIIVGGYDKK